MRLCNACDSEVDEEEVDLRVCSSDSTAAREFSVHSALAQKKENMKLPLFQVTFGCKLCPKVFNFLQAFIHGHLELLCAGIARAYS